MKNCCLPRCWPGSPLTPPRPKPIASPLRHLPPFESLDANNQIVGFISIWPTRKQMQAQKFYLHQPGVRQPDRGAEIQNTMR